VDRRTFLGTLAGGLATAPLAAEAQQTEKVYRIAILGNVPLNDAEGARLWGALSQGLGYVEGQNIAVNHQSSEGRYERLPALAAELIRWRPDVIVVPNNSNALAAREATQTIPIVAATFAEASGLIASLARPGGNVTGLTFFTSEMVVKQLELPKEMVYPASRAWPSC
jgi:putative ABC transport system substrate-binding protein